MWVSSWAITSAVAAGDATWIVSPVVAATLPTLARARRDAVPVDTCTGRSPTMAVASGRYVMGIARGRSVRWRASSAANVSAGLGAGAVTTGDRRTAGTADPATAERAAAVIVAAVAATSPAARAAAPALAALAAAA